MSERLSERERETAGWLLGRNRVFPRLFTFGLDVVGASGSRSAACSLAHALCSHHHRVMLHEPA